MNIFFLTTQIDLKFFKFLNLLVALISHICKLKLNLFFIFESIGLLERALLLTQCVIFNKLNLFRFVRYHFVAEHIDCVMKLDNLFILVRFLFLETEKHLVLRFDVGSFFFAS